MKPTASYEIEIKSIPFINYNILLITIDSTFDIIHARLYEAFNKHTHMCILLECVIYPDIEFKFSSLLYSAHPNNHHHQYKHNRNKKRISSEILLKDSFNIPLLIAISSYPPIQVGES